MANKLAKLADLKDAIDADTTGIDDELTALLEAAASISESIAGVVDGGLRRAESVTLYPVPFSDRSALIGLDRRPIESISSIKLLYGPATPTEFSAVTALVEGTDFYVKSPELGTLGLYDDWWRPYERSNQVTGTFGFADPDDAPGSGNELYASEALQRANVEQAVMLWNQRRTAGLKGVEAGGASGGMGMAIHPRLREAAMRYRRAFL